MHNGKNRKKERTDSARKQQRGERRAVQKKTTATKTYHYLGITINEEGNLAEHVKVIAKKIETISREIDAAGAENQPGKEEIGVNLKLHDTCIMTALASGMEAWQNKRSVEMTGIRKIQEMH